MPAMTAGRKIIIVPTYNERHSLSPLAEALEGQSLGADLLIVDDNSPDGTADFARTLTLEGRPVKTLVRPKKMGIARAYLDGFRYALEGGYDFICQMDADLSHDPSALPGMLKLLEGYDLVVGSRYIKEGGIRGWSFHRYLLSWGGNIYARLILGVPVRDLTAGFKCWRRATLEALELEEVFSEGYAFQVEMTYRALKKGFRVKEFPIIFSERAQGSSKMSWRIFFEAIFAIWRLKWSIRGKE